MNDEISVDKTIDEFFEGRPVAQQVAKTAVKELIPRLDALKELDDSGMCLQKTPALTRALLNQLHKTVPEIFRRAFKSAEWNQPPVTERYYVKRIRELKSHGEFLSGLNDSLTNQVLELRGEL